MTLQKITQGLWMPASFIAALSLVSPVSEAAIIYSGIKDTHLLHDSGDRVEIRMGGAPDIFEIREIRGAFSLWRSNIGSYSTATYPGSSLTLGISAETLINSEYNWSSIRGESVLLAYDEFHPRYEDGDFFDQTDKFIAIRILDDTDVFFGWIRVSHSIADQQFVIHDWAWNSVAGAPIMAGVIPEPATLAFFAGLFGLGGAFFFRRRRK